MDYEENYEDFLAVLKDLDYNSSFRMNCILSKIEYYVACYDKETTDEGRQDCLEYVTRVSDLYLYDKLEQAFLTLGLDIFATQDELLKNRSRLLLRFSDKSTKANIKAYDEVVLAYDFIQCFREAR